ncbi:MAG TPA: hypothetical protein VGE74_08560 [Gemmata sp.]
MTTTHTVRVLKPFFRRKWLYLLPGTEWTVTAVEPRGRSAPVYTLVTYGYEIERQEWRVQPLQNVKPKRRGT